MRLTKERLAEIKRIVSGLEHLDSPEFLEDFKDLMAHAEATIDGPTFEEAEAIVKARIKAEWDEIEKSGGKPSLGFVSYYGMGGFAEWFARQSLDETYHFSKTLAGSLAALEPVKTLEEKKAARIDDLEAQLAKERAS